MASNNPADSPLPPTTTDGNMASTAACTQPRDFLPTTTPPPPTTTTNTTSGPYIPCSVTSTNQPLANSVSTAHTPNQAPIPTMASNNPADGPLPPTTTVAYQRPLYFQQRWSQAEDAALIQLQVPHTCLHAILHAVYYATLRPFTRVMICPSLLCHLSWCRTNMATCGQRSPASYPTDPPLRPVIDGPTSSRMVGPPRPDSQQDGLQQTLSLGRLCKLQSPATTPVAHGMLPPKTYFAAVQDASGTPA